MIYKVCVKKYGPFLCYASVGNFHMKHAHFNWQPYQFSIWLSHYFKPYCQLCHCRLTANTILCEECHQSIYWLPSPKQVELIHQKILTIQAISYYQYPIDKIIRNFKFHEDIQMIPILYHLIGQLPCPKNHHANNSVILAMPTTNQRMAKRGFDPLTILVPYLAKHWQIPVWRGVQRIDDSTSQRVLSKLERQKNISGAFSVTDELAVKKVLIFDDIATTGASLQELANTLLQENPQLEIHAYCLAHGSL